jgi:hypothetical protein
MSAMLQKILIALGRRGVQVPIDATLANAYRALQRYHEAYPSVFTQATEVLLAEVEGGATNIADVPQRLGHIVQMLDRLTREEELEMWSEDQVLVTV